jgi:hypothetical protein
MGAEKGQKTVKKWQKPLAKSGSCVLEFRLVEMWKQAQELS